MRKLFTQGKLPLIAAGQGMLSPMPTTRGSTDVSPKGWVPSKGAILFVAALLVLAGGATTMVVNHRHHDRTQADWQLVSNVAAELEQGGDWRIRRAWPPCVQATPEAFINLEATVGGDEPVARLYRNMQDMGWTLTAVDEGLGSTGFSATTSAGRARLVLEQPETGAEIELSVDERC